MFVDGVEEGCCFWEERERAFGGGEGGVGQWTRYGRWNLVVTCARAVERRVSRNQIWRLKCRRSIISSPEVVTLKVRLIWEVGRQHVP